MTNARIAEKLDLLADLMEFTGVDAFRLRAYRNAARVIAALPESVATLLNENRDALLAIDGIGDSIARKCATLVSTGTLPQLEDLLKTVPTSVLDMLRVPNLGPKKAAILYRELSITTLDQLKTACEAGKVRVLKGFGEKTEAIILKGLAIAEAANQRLSWAQADQIATALRHHFADCPGLRKFELAGSYRRGKETVGDLDILVVSVTPDTVMDRFGTFHDIAAVQVRGDTKMSVRLSTGQQIDLRVVPDASFGAALQYFTGSKEHNVILRGLAKQHGLRINEYGVFKDETAIAGATEEEVYATLNLPAFPPELREGGKEYEWAEKNELPTLITLADMHADLHAHTTYSDGKASIREMVAAARNRGLSCLAITDHSKRVAMANGLDPDRLRAQWKEIDQINRELEGAFVVLKGVECDILENGDLDLPDDTLAEADWTVASVHYGQNQPREQITDRIVGALANPYIHAIGHPTGRLINRREPYDIDLDTVMRAARSYRKYLELNADPARLDLCDHHCAAAKSNGVPIVINTDAHSVTGLDNMRYGILVARRAGLSAADVLNTRPADQLVALLKATARAKPAAFA